jgi:hypothetical protein
MSQCAVQIVPGVCYLPPEQEVARSPEASGAARSWLRRCLSLAVAAIAGYAISSSPQSGCEPVMPETPDKVRENRVRRMAERQGLILRKSRRRDRRAWDFGSYWLMDAERNALVFPDVHGGSLEDMERYLTSE